MKRRNFVIGLGALSAGGAAAIGTGAFSAVEAERSVSVELADDADAYLAFESTSDYAIVDDDGVLELDFGQDLGEDQGEHVGENSTYFFGSGDRDENAFQIVNQGTETVELDPQQQVMQFDKEGDPVDEDGELLIAITTNNSADGGIEISPGNREGYFVRISTGDSPPDSVEATFEINAEKVED